MRPANSQFIEPTADSPPALLNELLCCQVSWSRRGLYAQSAITEIHSKIPSDTCWPLLFTFPLLADGHCWFSRPRLCQHNGWHSGQHGWWCICWYMSSWRFAQVTARWSAPLMERQSWAQVKAGRTVQVLAQVKAGRTVQVLAQQLHGCQHCFWRRLWHIYWHRCWHTGRHWCSRGCCLAVSTAVKTSLNFEVWWSGAMAHKILLFPGWFAHSEQKTYWQKMYKEFYTLNRRHSTRQRGLQSRPSH